MRSFCSTLLCSLSLLLALPLAEANTSPGQPAAPGGDSRHGESASLTVQPVPGDLSSEFGPRQDPVRRKRRRKRRQRMHKGLDFIAQRGTHVHAAGPGVVVKAQVTGSYGRLVIVDHGGGLQTRYAHLQRFKVRKGQRVEAGKVLGLVGSSGRVTGPHLHFEVRQDGTAVAPQNIVQFTVPNCSPSARRCKSTSQPLRSERPNS